MEPPVIAALISGTSSLIGGSLATHFATRFFEQRDLPVISKDRRTALNGRWQGIYQQDVGPSGNITDYAMKVDFTAKRKSIAANIELVLSFEGTTYHITYNGKGNYVDNRFIKLGYESAEAGVMQFGFMILEYSPLGYILTGRFVAFGAITQRLVSGNINLQKIVR